jgi:hypothetical protein
MQRVQLRHEVTALRARGAWSVPILGVFTLLTGSSRGAGWIAKVAGILGIARTVFAMVRLLKG